MTKVILMGFRIFIAFILTAIIVLSCNKLLPPELADEDVLAIPLADLSPDQLNRHIIGDEEFAKIFSKEDGLGPIFVQASCESCHVGDGKGNPENNLTRFGVFSSGIDHLLKLGGPQLQHRALPGFEPEKIPDEADGVTELIAPNVTGMGYLAAVRDSFLMSIADPLDVDGDGISGILSFVSKPDYLQLDDRYHQAQGSLYIGRFGRKASAIDLTMQTVNAYKNDMGITSDGDLVDPINMQVSVVSRDDVPDPEVPASTLANVVFYLQTLEAPRRRNETDSDVIAGNLLFKKAGCDGCHRQTMTTGPSEIEALNRVTFSPYTDLLLHDMGPDLDDNYTEGSATTSEWRTTPLWGLGLQKDLQGSQMFLMHDGRATSYEDAIQLHGGEAEASRDQYFTLTQEEKNQLEVFLNSL